MRLTTSSAALSEQACYSWEIGTFLPLALEGVYWLLLASLRDLLRIEGVGMQEPGVSSTALYGVGKQMPPMIVVMWQRLLAPWFCGPSLTSIQSSAEWCYIAIL